MSYGFPIIIFCNPGVHYETPCCVVIVHIIWLYITVVVVVISFSIIVSCTFISLLLVTVGIVYSRASSNVNVAISILFDGENISFDASLVMYINSTIVFLRL